MCVALACALTLGAAVARADCPTTPDVTCKFAAAASLAYTNNEVDDKDAFAFKLSHGAHAVISDFGDPTTTDSFEVCVYANGALAASMVVPPDGDCEDKSCWVAKAKGPAFKDKVGTHDGVKAIALAAPKDSSDTTKINAKGKGPNLPEMSLPLDTPIGVQVRNSIGNCWGVFFNDATQDPTTGKLKAKLKDETFPTCSDGLLNGFETDVDCGAACTACSFDKYCDGNDDCASGICRSGRCGDKRLFVTPATYKGALGGLAGADATCQSVGAAQMPGTSWVAWLSTDTVSAIDRINDAAYRLVNGTLAFDNKAQIATGLMRPWDPIGFGPNGAPVAGNIWTGTSNGGAAVTGFNCNDWTSNLVGVSGLSGTPSNTPLWSGAGFSTCDTQLHLLCFEQ